jgi:DNA mismatch endonuclease (patch repair protein)
MTERLTTEQRSRNMSAIRGKNTKPELLVRSIAHRLGYRFRLHRVDLPGTPDLVFRAAQKIINVHGCFWHVHSCAKGKLAPVNNAAFWQKKRNGNRERDRRTLRQLRRAGWRVLIVWECETKDRGRLTHRISSFLAR